MEHGEDAVPVWSTVAASDRTQICPAQKFFVSAGVLERLQLAFGPGKAQPKSYRKTNWQRYGWELIREIIGEDKLVASKKQPGIGIVKLLNSLTNSDTDILSAVLYYSRKLFSLEQLKSRKLGKARVGFLDYCLAMARYWLSKLGLPKTKRCPTVRRKSTKRSPQVSGNSPLSHSIRSPRRPSSPATLPVCKAEVPDSESFMNAAAENNLSVSLEQLHEMMKDEALLKEVDTLRRLQQSITEHEPHGTQLTDEAEDIDEETFVQLKQSQVEETFYIPVEALQQWRGTCSAELGHESHDADGQVCLRCAKHCSDSAELLIHLARNHFIPIICSNSLRDPGRSAPTLSSGSLQFDHKTMRK